MFFDGLGEIRPDELGATLAPLQIVLAEDHTLRGAWVKAAVKVIDLAPQSDDSVATVVLEEGNGGQTQLLCSDISPLAAPEALSRWIGDIEQQERIR
jgi:hypothetical protein